jgi:hypothetical protein
MKACSLLARALLVLAGSSANRIGHGVLRNATDLDGLVKTSHLWMKMPGQASRWKAGRPSMLDTGPVGP